MGDSTKTVTMTGLAILLVHLILGPYTWDAAKISNFVRDAYNVIKMEMERRQKIEMFVKQKLDNLAKGKGPTTKVTLEDINKDKDAQAAKFVRQMIKDSGQVIGENSWVDIIKSMWDILKLDETGKDRYKLDTNDQFAVLKKYSVAHLFKGKRDKFEHIRSYRNCKKEEPELSQFFDKDANGNFHLNENKFISFWISSFPKLMPFLWLKFYQYKDDLKGYYPADGIDISQIEHALLNLSMYEKEIQTALIRHVEKGNLLKRLIQGNNRCSLELRDFPNLINIWEKRPFVITINPKDKISLTVSHLDSANEKLEYVGDSAGNENLILIFAFDIEDDKLWNACINCDCRVVLFCDPDKLNDERVEKAVNKFRLANKLTESELIDSPLELNELSEDTQNLIFEQGQVSIQDKLIKIKNIFPTNSTSIIGGLSGQLLNKMLRQEKAEVCETHKIPEHNGRVYIKRQVYLRNDNEMCRLVPGSGITNVELVNTLIVLNTSPRNLFTLVDSKYVEVFENADDLYSKAATLRRDCRVILLHEPKKISEELIKKFENALGSRCLGFIQFDSTGYKTRRIQLGSNLYWRDCYNREFISEDDLLEQVSSKGMNTLFLLADAGMGKSSLLASLAKMLKSSLVGYCTFAKFIDYLKRRVETPESLTMLDIKAVILDVVGCKKESDRRLISLWLEQSGESIGNRIELMLDSLNKVSEENLDFARKVVNLIQKDFKVIRLWIASTKIFPGEITDLTYFSLCPFSFHNKIQFFEQSWKDQESAKLLTQQQLRDRIDRMLISLISLTDLRRLQDFTDSPLNCSMIAKFHSSNISELSAHKVVSVGKESVENLHPNLFETEHLDGLAIDFDGDSNEQRERFIKIITYCALLQSFPQIRNEFKGSSLFDQLHEDTYHQVVTTTEQPLVFDHPTSTHLFLVKFVIYQLICGQELNAYQQMFVDQLVGFGVCNLIAQSDIPFWRFLDDFLKEKSEDELSCLNKWNLREDFKIPFFLESRSSQLINSGIKNHLWHLTRLLITFWVDETDGVVCNQILHLALNSGVEVNVFKEMCGGLNHDNEYKLLKCSIEIGNDEIAKNLIETCCPNDLFDIIKELKASGKTEAVRFAAEKVTPANYLIDPQRFVEDAKSLVMSMVNMIRVEHNLNKRVLID